MAKKTKDDSTLLYIVNYFHNHVQALNNSKVFAGLMIITLNIVSRFVNIKLGKTLESYLKYSFSKQILVFTIAWMGTRDIYIALFIMICFIIITEVLLHEESKFFILSENTRDHYINLLESNEQITEEDIKRAKEILEKASIQKKNNLSSNNNDINDINKESDKSNNNEETNNESEVNELQYFSFR